MNLSLLDFKIYKLMYDIIVEKNYLFNWLYNYIMQVLGIEF